MLDHRGKKHHLLFPNLKLCPAYAHKTASLHHIQQLEKICAAHFTSLVNGFQHNPDLLQNFHLLDFLVLRVGMMQFFLFAGRKLLCVNWQINAFKASSFFASQVRKSGCSMVS